MNPKKIKTILGILGFVSLELQEGKAFLNEDDVQKLRDAYQEKFGADLVLEGISFDEDGNASFLEAELVSIETAFNQEAPEKPEGKAEETGEENKEVKELEAKVIKLFGTVQKLEASLKKEKAKVIKLGAKPEYDIAPILPGVNNTLRHSKTHLFGSNQSFDAFEDRPWNQRAASGIVPKGNEYTPIDISKLNEDLGAYYRENKMGLITFLRNKNRLPKNWNTVSNIQDEVAYAKAFTGEVTQARKKKWLPKSDFEFQPEIAKVNPIQIDLEIAGHELQSMETSWMNHLAMVSKDGSQPYKMSFVAWMAGEFLKKAAEEDQISHVRGILIPTGDSATKAGLAIHKSEGLLKKIQKAQARRVYKPYDLGVPTLENIYDYVEKFVMTVPEYWRDMPGMVLYMAEYWKLAYLKRRELIKGLIQTYSGDSLVVDRHENIRIEGLPFMNDAQFMFMTTDDNISILENIPSEKTLLTIEKSKRDIAIIGDYKIGIHVWAFGYQWPEDAEMTDEKQIFFSNSIDILPDQYVDAPANATTLNAQYHTSLRTGENTQATAITTISNVETGQYVYIRGNKGDNPSTIADAGHFDLSGAITLTENMLIKLYKRGTNDFVEIQRWDLNKSNVVFLAANATKADADLGKVFVTQANSGATAFTDIENAVEGDIYKLEGGSSTNATTIAASGKFSRIKESMTLANGHWIKVKFNGEKFVELARYTG